MPAGRGSGAQRAAGTAVRRPLRPRSRRREVAAGLASGVLLLVTVLGLPLLLSVVAPLALPASLPGWGDVLGVLGSRDDGTLLRSVLVLLAWCAWLAVAGSVLLEIVSVLSERPTPRLPLLGVPQQCAAALVAATVLAMTPATGAVGPQDTPRTAAPAGSVTAVSRPGPTGSQPGHVETGGCLPAGAGLVGSGTPSAVGVVELHRAADRWPTVRVRRHDTLWGLAERHLGSGARFREIVELNAGRRQPDGRALTDAHWIYPGWVLRLPLDAAGADHATPAGLARPAVPTAAAQVDRGPDPRSSTGHTRLGPGRAAAVALAPAPAGDVADGGAPTGPAGPTGSMLPASTARVEAQEQLPPLVSVGLGALTVAGVLAEVARQRRRRQAVRAVGERLPQSSAQAARTELALRAVHDGGRGARITNGLALLASGCAEAGRDLPELAWVRVGATTLHLVMAGDDPDVVPPFDLTSPQTWTWSDADHLPSAPEQEPCPYPALVSVGLDGEDLVLVNMEAAGRFRVGGAPDDAATVIAAMTVDLLGRARRNEVNLSVSPGRLQVPIPDGVRSVPTAEAASAQLGAHQRAVGDVLAECGVSDVRAARSAGVADETWVPEIVVTEGVVGPTAPWSGAVAVHADPSGDGQWALEPMDGRRWRLDPPGVVVEPARIGAVDLAGISNLVSPVVAQPDVTDEPSLGVEVARAGAALAQVAVRGGGAPDAPRVLLLGPVQVLGCDDSLVIGRRRRSAELVAYLVLHPGAGRHELDEVLWPGRRVGRSTRNPFVSRTRQWLGRTAGGEAYLPLVAETGEYRLREEVGCDWYDFVTYARQGLAPPEPDLDRLQAALALVRARPFQGIDPATYCWAEPDIQEMVSAIVDVAHVLSAASYLAGDLRTGAAAAARGLLVDPGSELLHRDALRAAAAGGDPGELSRAVGRLRAQLDPDEDLTPPTQMLLDELGLAGDT
jgi:DNA-binding SARP family transcriptional activator